ncbi:hypothetical protein [Dialister invisus]
MMSMISRAVIFEIATFFIFAACSLLSGSRYPFSRPAYRQKDMAYGRDGIAHIDLS